MRYKICYADQNREITNFKVLLATKSRFILKSEKEVEPSGKVNLSLHYNEGSLRSPLQKSCNNECIPFLINALRPIATHTPP